MRAIAFLMLLLAAQPANAGCFLFFCSRSHHHAQHHRHRHPHPHVIHKTIVVKKIVIVHDRKANAATVDRTPITPLK